MFFPLARCSGPLPKSSLKGGGDFKSPASVKQGFVICRSLPGIARQRYLSGIGPAARSYRNCRLIDLKSIIIAHVAERTTVRAAIDRYRRALYNRTTTWLH